MGEEMILKLILGNEKVWGGIITLDFSELLALGWVNDEKTPEVLKKKVGETQDLEGAGIDENVCEKDWNWKRLLGVGHWSKQEKIKQTKTAFREAGCH